MKKFISFLLICLMLLSVLTSCGKPDLEGRWILCNADGEELNFKIKFKDDGTIRCDHKNGEYKFVDGDTVEIKFDGKEYKCDFEIIDKDRRIIYLGEFSDKIYGRKLEAQACFLVNAVNSVLKDMEDKDIKYIRDALICSDSSKNVNAVPENADEDFDFIDNLEVFFPDIRDYEFILYIDGYYNNCSKTAVKSGNSMGTYYLSEFEGMSFDEICEILKKNIEFYEELTSKTE
ncbi:MAG: hypothetical protein K2J08_11870 [Ruminococcus sp.]|nr:hypothetical protein [Ruminococcus sp.]